MHSFKQPESPHFHYHYYQIVSTLLRQKRYLSFTWNNNERSQKYLASGALNIYGRQLRVCFPFIAQCIFQIRDDKKNGFSMRTTFTLF